MKPEDPFACGIRKPVILANLPERLRHNTVEALVGIRRVLASVRKDGGKCHRQALASGGKMSPHGDHTGQALTRDQILVALGALSEKLGNDGTKGEICLFGGTAMMLAFTARLSTKDVDALFQPAQKIRDLARRVGEEQNLPEDWLNDAVKGFVSARHETTALSLPQFDHLRLTMPVPEYLLAMKCMAARMGGTTGESSDVADIRFLMRHLKLRSATDVLDLVARYYPSSQISVKTQYLIEGLFEEGTA